jgi:hypothetical protein
MTQKRRGPAASASRAHSKTATVCDQSTDLDQQLMGDRSIWAALFDGEFRLAIRCRRCGRWLTSGPSKRAGIGAHCAEVSR